MVSSVKIKICGLTNLDDAQVAVDLGADMLGFIFYPKSPRFIELDKAREIIDKIPTFVDIVGLFVNPDFETLRLAHNEGCFNWFQLHGDETPEFCRSIHWMNCRLMKAIRVRGKEDIEQASAFPADCLLLDTYNKDKYGGTGEQFDWSWLKPMNTPVMLSGGINPDNVIAAIDTGVNGIDICSGVESKPGKKDHNKMQQLFDNIRLATGRKGKNET